jgi:hypothetical protein
MSMHADHGSRSGEHFTGGSERASRTFGAGRVCKEEGCDVRLSQYNSGSFCSLHEPMAVPRTRGRKIA